MATLCLGALLAGLIAASLMSFLPFACAILVAIIIGASSTLVGGAQVVQTLLSAAVLLFTSQIGYGLGVVAAAFIGHTLAGVRRSRAGRQSARPTQALRTGNEPR